MAANRNVVNIEQTMELKPEQKLNSSIRRFFNGQLAQMRLAQKKALSSSKDARLVAIEQEILADLDVVEIIEEHTRLQKKLVEVYARSEKLGIEINSDSSLKVDRSYGDIPSGRRFTKLRREYRRVLEEAARAKDCSCEIGRDLLMQEFDAKLSTLTTVKEAKALLDSFRETLEGKI